MRKTVSDQRRKLLIEDIFSARYDVLDLAASYRLTPDQLAAWVAQEENHRCLSSLCVLADLQSQMLLSRYRVVAANRLIRLATDDADDAKKADVARRACVDLLRSDVRPTSINLSEDAAEDADDETSLRRLLYGQAENDDADVQ